MKQTRFLPCLGHGYDCNNNYDGKRRVSNVKKLAKMFALSGWMQIAVRPQDFDVENELLQIKCLENSR